MENAVRKFIDKHSLLHQGARVLVGVSGGPDSMALLHFLSTVREEWNLDLQVLSVDHQLRGEESEGDFNYVKQICKDWGLTFHGTSLDVRSHARTERISMEVAARELRYKFFAQKMTELHADYLALGHHGDDQVETLVMKLVRSATSTSFQGIPVQRPLAGGMIIRPLLAVTKSEIEVYCETHNIIPRIDATNLESIHTRNYYRHHVIPLLKEKNANLHRTAQHLSENLEEDETYMQKQAKKVLDEAVVFNHEKHQVIMDINLFKKHDQSLQRRAFHLILNYLYETIPSHLSYVHEEQFFSLIRKSHGNTKLDFPHCLKLNRAYDRLTFYFEQSYPLQENFNQMLVLPGTTYLPDGSVIKATYTATIGKETPFSLYIAASGLSLPLYVRTRKNGDRMSWKGLQGTRKLKDIFIDEKIPIERRNSWPIVVDSNGHILWLVGLKKGKQIEVNDKQFVCIQYEKGHQ
ncbi:tRNA lysidine(34) synthetase TilS [Oceanobacillus luteolus]|uniref:tRNA(Ile)-lysidine synthase n=1 Tax=Oceanobacillus luteolus TaxID=1274358 RepID=A0ABW4HMD2_9BACI